MTQSISLEPPLTLCALSELCVFLAALVRAHRLGFNIQLCSWKTEDMTLQTPTENVEAPTSYTKQSGIEFFS